MQCFALQISPPGWAHLPPEVYAEMVTDRGFAGEQATLGAVAAGWLIVTQAAPLMPDLPELDEGEAAGIRLALASGTPVMLSCAAVTS